MRSTKYSPAFQLSDASTADDTKMEITFVEFDEAKVTPTTEEAGPGAEQSPVIGLPLRNQTYEDSGIQGNLQMKAPRLMENEKHDSRGIHHSREGVPRCQRGALPTRK